MFKHKTRAIMLVAMLAVLVAAPSALAKTNHKYMSAVQSNVLSTDNGYPGVGGTAVLTGSLASTLGGFNSGALVDHVTITGQPKANVIAFKGTEAAFLARGLLRSTFTGTNTIQQDGSQEMAVDGRVTGGTGPYRGASGHYRFHGTVPPNSTVLSGGSTGSIRF